MSPVSTWGMAKTRAKSTRSGSNSLTKSNSNMLEDSWRKFSGSPKPIGQDNSFFTVQYDSVVLSDFLNQDVQTLIEYLEGFIADFLRGFYYAEGYASCSVDTDRRVIRNIQVGVVNTNPDYLTLVTNLLQSLGLSPHIHRTNRRGQKMAIRGKTWTRRNDVYHITLDSSLDIQRFSDGVGFWNPAKKSKLNDLLVMLGMGRKYRFDWFTSRYRKEGRKRVRRG